MTDYEQTHDAVNDLLEAAQEIGWSVEHYQLDSDAYEPVELGLQLELEPENEVVGVFETDTTKEDRSRTQAIKDIVGELEQKNDLGAEMPAVIDEATNGGEMDEKTAENELHKLKQRGEVYEPTTEHLRTT